MPKKSKTPETPDFPITNLILDDWQQEILATDGNICLRSGRQVGKSTIISIKCAKYAAENKNKNVMVVASVERQASLLFEKILNYLYMNYKSWIKKGKDKPTKHIIKLTNGSAIYCLPTGMSGYGIRGYTIDLLIVDEAAFVPEEVFTSIIPALAVTKGIIWLLSTPHGKEGYYYRCFTDPSFRAFHISSEECPRRDPDFLKREKARMTKAQYAQEYLGEFADELMQFFSSEIIKRAMVLDPDPQQAPFSQDNYLGVDVARMGEDESVFVSVSYKNDFLKMFGLKILTKTFLTDTADEVRLLDQIYDYKKIYIDDGGLGVGVLDYLLRDDQTRRKVEAINNSARAIDKDERRKKKLLKEDLYTNLLNLLEKQKIQLLNIPEIFLSLRSIQYEYLDNGAIRIFGDYSHITEALIRAAWCMKEKHLNFWVYGI